MDKADLNALFERYLEKRASADDIKQLLLHFQLEQESRLLRELIMEELASPLDNPQIADIKEGAVYRRVEQALEERINAEQNQRRKWSSHQLRVLRVAASLAAAVLIVAGLFLWRTNHMTMATSYAPNGKNLKIDLSDHSTVWLNSGAQLDYPTLFNSHVRNVSLKNGEAFFQVMHNSQSPFVIDAGNATITVLGTSFEVSDLDKGKEITVSVSTGKVGIRLAGNNQKATFVIAGQRAIIEKATNEINVEPFAAKDVAAWRQQVWIFDNQPLADVMQRLEQKYNVQIEIENPALLSERVTMRLGSQPLADVLTAISFANHFNYEKVSDQLIIVK